MDAAGWSSLFLLVLSVNCALVLSPGRRPQDGVWQPVAYTQNRFYVYSAFVIRSALSAVRVIGITNTKPPHDVIFCRMWLRDRRVLTLKARVQLPKVQVEKNYCAVFVLCQLPNSSVEAQETHGASLAVIASIAANKPPTNLLKVTYSVPPPGPDDYLQSLHVCVSPFHLSYDRVEWMIEWIEMNRLLGVSHFFMYNGSVSDQMRRLLSHYQQQGLITLYSWNLPITDERLISTRAQYAAINDCLYRSMSTTGWLLIMDTDEVVMPRRERKLTTLLDSLNETYTRQHRSKRIASLTFENFFFYLGFEDDHRSLVPLITSRKTRRVPSPRLPPLRNKYAVRPLEIIETGVHEIFEALPGAETVSVPVRQAIVHHYRVKLLDPKKNLQQLQRKSAVDRTAYRWTKDLWTRVKSKISKRTEPAG